MPLTPMAPDGRWLQAPHDAPPVYVPAKQMEAHFKRLIADGWMPIADPRREDEQAHAHALVQAEVQTASNEIAMQARIDQLEALVRQLLAQKSEQHDASTQHNGEPDSEVQADDRRPGRRKPAV